jgi:putative ABC transport system substrate-binding protein
MRERGYVEGRNMQLQLRYAPGNPVGLRAMVAEVMRAKPDPVLSSGPAIRAMMEARGVRVVFAISGDPVELVIAQKPCAPGG